jgi:mono/diheme cytochrome c family protein
LYITETYPLGYCNNTLIIYNVKQYWAKVLKEFRSFPNSFQKPDMWGFHMVLNLLTVLFLLALTGLFVLLFILAIRAKRVWVKAAGGILSGLLMLVFGAVLVVGLIGFFRIYLPRAAKPAEFQVSSSQEQVARGEHLASMLCVDCHTLNKQLPLSGGADLGEGAPFPLGSYPAYNLTPAGPLNGWSDADIFRAIRYNVDPNGRRLVFMSTTGIGYLSDDDIHAVIAYLRSQPATGEETRQEQPNPLAMLMVGGGMIPIQPRQDKVEALAPASNAEYGKYMVDFLSCRDCHGMVLTGGTNTLVPIGPSLLARVPVWSVEQFSQAIRTGKTPDGHMLNKSLMPWETYKNMDDLELEAVHMYLKSVK